jgi:solute carrier family 4 anion exchanger 2
VWVGIWLILVSLVVAAFQGSILVKHFTKFTKDIFTGLIALLFIISPFEKLAKIFNKHPLKVSISILLLKTYLVIKDLIIIFQKTETYCEAQGSFFYNTNSSDVCDDASGTCQAVTITNFEQIQEIFPNIALLSTFLMIGTFYISYSLRAFKSGKFLGRTVS